LTDSRENPAPTTAPAAPLVERTRDGDARSPYVWVLNLDAEHEFEGRAGYAPNRNLRTIVAAQQARLVHELLSPGDYLLREAASDGSRAADLELLRVPIDPLQTSGALQPPRLVELAEARGLPGLAWSPTPRALALLAAAHTVPAHSVDIEILRTVNARPFAARLHNDLRNESFPKHIAENLEQALQRLALPAPHGWLVRRVYGAAGRGRRRIRSGQPDRAEREWLGKSLQLGPLVFEPWVEIVCEYTRSGWVDDAGAVMMSRPCFQETTKTGAWEHTQHAAPNEVARGHDQELQAAFEAAGQALAQAGYSGPFGIDAYLHRQPGGKREVLNPLSEINARFTMDWSLATDPMRAKSRPRGDLRRVP